MVEVWLYLQARQQSCVCMQCHLLMKQLAASFKQFAQFSQYTLAEICLLEAVIATHLGLISTQTLERGCQKLSVVKTENLYLLRSFFFFPAVSPAAPEASAAHLWSSTGGSVCSYIQRTVCAAVCGTESAVFDSASSSAEVRSVRGSPAGLKRRNGLHILQRPLTRFVNLRLAPTHSAALK